MLHFFEAVNNQEEIYQNFKYLDFIEGEQSCNEIVKNEVIGKNFVRVTYNTSERIEIKEDDDLEQLFVPKNVLPKFKKDLGRIYSLIVG